MQKRPIGMGNSKTSDFFEANIRTFDAKHPYFCPKKSDVFRFRKVMTEQVDFVFLCRDSG